MKKILKRYDILLTIFLFLLMIPAEYFEWFATLENQTLSIRHMLRSTYGDPDQTSFPHDKIAVVVQDEAFFEEYGSFPLRRTDIGKIVANLKALGAKVLLVDMLMDFASSYGEDPVIAEYLAKAGNTVLVSQIVFREGRFQKINFPTETINEVTVTGYSNHTRTGNMLTRLRIYPEIGKKEKEWAIAVKAAAMYLNVSPRVENGALVLGDLKIKLDQFYDFRIDFPRFSEPTIDYLSKDPYVGISAMDILELDPEDEDDLEEYGPLAKDKIVLIGDTSEVSHDIFDTIVGQIYGVEILANEVATMLKGGRLRSASLGGEIALLLIFLVCLILVHLPNDLKNRALGIVALFLVYLAFCTAGYVYLSLVFSMSYTLVAGVLGFIFINSYLFFQERQQKSFIKNAFGQYLSPDVIDTLVHDPTKLSLGGERREMTAYFSDIAGFSTISEKLTPDQLVSLLNEYLTDMCDIIANHSGTVDKFEGDAIIAFWGAPLDQPDHAKLSCYATIDMQKRLVEMRKKFQQEGKPLVLVRMGVNTGFMVVGNMGSQKRMDYTMMGDAVNLAARLEGANKFYKSYTMISQFTYQQVKDDVDVRELDTIRVVGKNEPITVYELLDRKNQVTGARADLIEKYYQALDFYKSKRFQDAIEKFKAALSLDPSDGPCLTYLSRCEGFLKSPPPGDWDGVHNLTSKG